MVTVLWGAFALSLFGSIHCMGMCGGFDLLAKGTNSSFFSRSLLIYLVGKTVTYSALGLILGFLGGAIYISQAINERLLQGIASGHQAFNDSPLDVLSDRELEVFEMTGRGIGTRDIAERLNLSVKTIESYRARVKTKLNLANASELMQHAVQWVESESLETRS